MKDLSKEIRAYAVKNALEFGKADVGKILPKLFQHGLDKKDIPLAMNKIKEIVNEVNLLGANELQNEFSNLSGVVKEREEKEKTLPELVNAVEGKVVTRFPPEPSKYLHLGHALTLLINSIYSAKYKGKFVLRFEDANPEKVSKEYVSAILDDVKNYLNVKFDKVSYVSDDIPVLYKFALNLINQNFAYMCFCQREEMQKFRHEGIECRCRIKSEKSNLEEWNLALKGKYSEGEVVLRLKGDMKSLNHVMRDPVLFRVIKKKHFRLGKKYYFWPTYDFYSPIEEDICGVTHILRSNEFDARIELQEFIKEKLNLKNQEVVQFGRFNVIDAETKGRDIREGIKSGDYSGWDDPRLVTLRALKRRGIRKEVLMELVNYIGLSKKQVFIDFDMVASISRKLFDSTTKRFYFVENPTKLKINKMPTIKSVNVKIHPDREETRKIKIGKEVYISSKDFESFKGQEVRLMNLFTIKINDKSEFITLENKNVQKIQWVSSPVDVRIMMDNGKWISGFADDGIKKLKVGDLVQFERFGFVKLDRKVRKSGKDVFEFWFTHA